MQSFVCRSSKLFPQTELGACQGWTTIPNDPNFPWFPTLSKFCPCHHRLDFGLQKSLRRPSLLTSFSLALDRPSYPGNLHMNK
jgi:hypothetical protein